jgi:hypothetical protein
MRFKLPIVAAVMSWLSFAACSAPSADSRFVATAPDRASFPLVADLLVHRCGSLDCHGKVERNLRLYGFSGLRLSPTDRPNVSTKTTTTAEEYDADYLSVVGLEPELLSQVVQQNGANPERLTLLRKALGTEAHKGEVLFTEGDDHSCYLSMRFVCLGSRRRTP